MLWKFLLAAASILSSPFRAPVDPDYPYEATRYGPQSREDEHRARHALQGEYDDIKHPEGDYPSYAGRNGTQYRWPGYPGGGEIPYELDPSIQSDQTMTQLIADAIEQYETNTCIRFKVRSTETEYVRIIKDTGCYSYVGKIARPQPQTLSLGSGCEYIGTVVHELGHAIGLRHEHKRSDRDTYITVYENNVVAGAINNFKKTDKSEELTFGAPYDCTSIMHYGEYAFSKDPGNLKTMVANDGTTTLLEPYDRPGLNNNDIDLVNKLYQC